MIDKRCVDKLCFPEVARALVAEGAEGASPRAPFGAPPPWLGQAAIQVVQCHVCMYIYIYIWAASHTMPGGKIVRRTT